MPTDRRSGLAPQELERLLGAGNASELTTTWNTYRGEDIPPALERQLDDALRRLRRGGDKARQAAIDVGQAALDLLLQYRPPAVIDRARFDLWTRQVQLDAAARDEGALKGDAATLERIADRFSHGPEIRSLLRQLRQQADTSAFAAAASTASQLRDNVASIASP